MTYHDISYHIIQWCCHGGEDVAKVQATVVAKSERTQRGSRGGLYPFRIWLPCEPGVAKGGLAIDAIMHCDVDAVGESKQMEAFDWNHCHQPAGRCSYRHFSTLKKIPAIVSCCLSFADQADRKD